jgi:Domain of unknown function (DUF5658)
VTLGLYLIAAQVLFEYLRDAPISLISGPDVYMKNVLLIFLLLQIADLATTLMTMRLGGVELNPLVRMFMSAGPVAGLFLAKLVVVGIAAGCAAMSKYRTLLRANIVFTGIVVWNITVIARLLA